MALFAAGLLAGCASSLAPVEEGRSDEAAGSTPDSHRVVRGDTLHAIAWRYGLNPKDLAAWNRLSSPDLIYAGQRLRLKPAKASPATSDSDTPLVSRPPPTGQPKSAPAANTADRLATLEQTRLVNQRPWSWPTEGKLVHGFQPEIPGGKGIAIGGRLGQPVRAASPGQVVYSGSGLPGYGRLIIVKHSDVLLSAYGYLGRILVKEGDKVEIGQSIAELGASSENLPVLHFEIRLNGKPVNPMRFLPATSAGGEA